MHIPLRAAGIPVDWERVRAALTRAHAPDHPQLAAQPDGRGAVRGGPGRRSRKSCATGPIVLLSDEVYEHIIFDGLRHESLLRHAELAARSLVVSSFGKTYHATGWKIGYCVAPAALSAEFRKVHQFVQFCVVTPMQQALAEFLESAPAHYLDLPAFYQAKRDLFCALLAPSRFRLTPSAGTYFQLLDYGAITRERDVEFARRLTREAGVASIPVSVFYREPPDVAIAAVLFRQGRGHPAQQRRRSCAGSEGWA